MTTNAGVQETQRKSIGFQQQDMSHDAMAVINKTFSPEFRNRLDHTIWFNHLDAVIHQVVDKFIVELQVQLDAKGVSLEVSEGVRHWLAEKDMTGPWERDPWDGSSRNTSSPCQ
jgi:ATP-dependent Clp protease ATP-binding subunit ClpA